MGQEKFVMILKNEFEHIWINDTQKILTTNKFPQSTKIKFDPVWNKVLETITSESKSLEIVQINSQSDDVLDYDRT